MTHSFAQVHGNDERWRQVLTVIEHEMRSPLAAALMQLTLVEHAMRGLGSMERAQDVLAGAKRQISGLSVVLRRVMELQTTGRVGLSPRTLDIRHLADDLLVRLKSTDPVLWSRVEVRASGAVTGSWDVLAVEQILENLLSNALKFGREAPVRLTISPTPTGARLVVEDQGIGINGEDRGRIFALFGRAAATRAISGCGIGLWVVRQLVRAHGGRIRVKSRQGAGSTFAVWLPRRGRLPIRVRGRVAGRFDVSGLLRRA
jgi:signal transduction histidine kinase